MRVMDAVQFKRVKETVDVMHLCGRGLDFKKLGRAASHGIDFEGETYNRNRVLMEN
jgi:hypothetical protein